MWAAEDNSIHFELLIQPMVTKFQGHRLLAFPG
jgi:hypothetical protein